MALQWLFFMLWMTCTEAQEDKKPLCEKCICHREAGQVAIDCSNKKLLKVPTNIPPNTQSLILSNNLIKEIPNFSFNGTNLSYLDISNNLIKKLYKYSLHGLNSLVELQLHNNKIPMKQDSYPLGVFTSLGNLTTINLASNADGLKYPDESFSQLLSLQYLNMDGLSTLKLGIGFANLTQLKVLNFTGKCFTEIITNESFVNVPKLEALILSGCHITQIEVHAFSMFSQLKLLDLSFNMNLGLDAATVPMVNLNSSAFRVFNISAIVPTFSIGVKLTISQVRRFGHLNITELYLDHNRIELFDALASSFVPSTIKVFSVRDNKPTFGYYLLTLYEMKQMICLDASLQYTSHIPHVGHNRNTNDNPTSRNYLHQNCPYFTNQHGASENNIKFEPLTSSETDNKAYISLVKWFSMGKEERNNLEIPIPKNIRYVNVSHSKLGYHIPKLQFQKNNVEIIDISSNILDKWYGPIYGADNVVYLSLRNNYCDEVHPDFFIGMGNIRTLHIGSNFLAFPFEYDVNGTILQPLSKLEILDISDNQIRLLPKYFLKKQVKLKYLDLSNNKMTKWTLETDHMTALEYIDLSNNSLTTLPASLRSFAESLHQKHMPLKINLSGQTLQCRCDNLDFLKWMMTTKTVFVGKDDYKCEDQHGKLIKMDNLPKIVTSLEKQCASYTMMIIILTTSIFGAIIIVVGSLVYRYRWKLRYLYYLARSRYRGYSAIGGAAQNNFVFDAFISYADEDRRLVINDMIQKLEREEGLQLCIHHRDFLVGEVIAANIANAVRNSKKTLVLLSRNFLASGWCEYELNMAITEGASTGRNVVIVIVYEEIPVKELSRELIQLIKNDCYIEYTDEPEGNALFWERLIKAVRDE